MSERRRYQMPLDSIMDPNIQSSSELSPLRLKAPVLIRGDFSFGPSASQGLLLNGIPRASPVHIASLLEKEGMSLMGRNGVDSPRRSTRPSSEYFENVKLPPIRNNFTATASNTNYNNQQRQSIPSSDRLQPLQQQQQFPVSSARSVPSGLNNLIHSSPAKPSNEDEFTLIRQLPPIPSQISSVEIQSQPFQKPTRDFWHAQCVFYSLPSVGSSRKLMENLWRELGRDPLSPAFSNPNSINVNRLRFSGQLKLLEEDMRREWERKFQDAEEEEDDDMDMDEEGLGSGIRNSRNHLPERLATGGRRSLDAVRKGANVGEEAWVR